VEIHPAARKHGIADEDIDHAVEHGRTAIGTPITDELVSKLAKKAEAGYDAEQTLRRRGGRPRIGSAAASVESVRLDPELRQALANRAKRDHETTSSVIRKALRDYLKLA
jgi:hypothetical protein